MVNRENRNKALIDAACTAVLTQETAKTIRLFSQLPPQT